jgi:hypothetical protein
MRGSPIFIAHCATLTLFLLGGFFVFHMASAMVHLLFIFAFLSLKLHFVLGSAAS